MRRIKNRIFSVLLAVVIAAGLFTDVTVHAQNAEEEIEVTEAQSRGVTLVWPVPGHTRISQGFHDGKAIDISDGSITGAPVVAAMGGIVTNIFLCGNTHYNYGDCNGFGTGLVIQGDDGRFYQYAHMQAGSIPPEAYRTSRVEAGQQIGRVGSTGFSYGAHLHFGISTGTYWSESGINPQNETYIYNNTPAPVTMGWENDECQPGETDARIAARAVSNIRGTFTQAGAVIWDASGAEAASQTEEINTESSYLNVWYDVTDEMGAVLKAGSDYTYQFFVVFNGKRYESSVNSFQTLPASGQPTIPADPMDPDRPDNPGEPADPGNPTDPSNPGNPSDPTDPDAPGEGECTHDYSEWETISKATVFDAEEQERYCSLCGEIEFRTVGTVLTPTIRLSTTDVRLKTRQSATVRVSGLAAGDYVAGWETSNRNVAVVSSTGKITARSRTGSAVVTVTLASGKTARVTVKVQKSAVQTTKISGLKKSMTLKVKGRATLRPVIWPAASTQKVTYKSSNKKVVTVSTSGKVTAKKRGKAVIMVKSGKKSVKVSVRVK